jgi:hypothetical protein
MIVDRLVNYLLETEEPDINDFMRDAGTDVPVERQWRCYKGTQHPHYLLPVKNVGGRWLTVGVNTYASRVYISAFPQDFFDEHTVPCELPDLGHSLNAKAQRGIEQVTAWRGGVMDRFVESEEMDINDFMRRNRIGQTVEQWYKVKPPMWRIHRHVYPVGPSKYPGQLRALCFDPTDDRKFYWMDIEQNLLTTPEEPRLTPRQSRLALRMLGESEEMDINDFMRDQNLNVVPLESDWYDGGFVSDGAGHVDDSGNYVSNTRLYFKHVTPTTFLSLKMHSSGKVMDAGIYAIDGDISKNNAPIQFPKLAPEQRADLVKHVNRWLKDWGINMVVESEEIDINDFMRGHGTHHAGNAYTWHRMPDVPAHDHVNFIFQPVSEPKRIRVNRHGEMEYVHWGVGATISKETGEVAGIVFTGYRPDELGEQVAAPNIPAELVRKYNDSLRRAEHMTKVKDESMDDMDINDFMRAHNTQSSAAGQWFKWVLTTDGKPAYYDEFLYVVLATERAVWGVMIERGPMSLQPHVGGIDNDHFERLWKPCEEPPMSDREKAMIPTLLPEVRRRAGVRESVDRLLEDEMDINDFMRQAGTQQPDGTWFTSGSSWILPITVNAGRRGDMIWGVYVNRHELEAGDMPCQTGVNADYFWSNYRESEPPPLTPEHWTFVHKAIAAIKADQG